MAKKEIKKLTLDDLIAKKIEKEKNTVKYKEIEVPSLGGTLTFEKPLDEDVIECIDNIGDGTSTLKILEAYDKLIYSCCPQLKNTKLQESLDIKVPNDIVKELLDLSDRMLVGNELIKFSGIDSLNEKIKN